MEEEQFGVANKDSLWQLYTPEQTLSFNLNWYKLIQYIWILKYCIVILK